MFQSTQERRNSIDHRKMLCPQADQHMVNHAVSYTKGRFKFLRGYRLQMYGLGIWNSQQSEVSRYSSKIMNDPKD